MVLLYIVMWIAQLWSGLCGVRLGVHVLRLVRHHHRPYAISAFGIAFVSAGVFICVLSSYQTYQALGI